MLAKTITDDSLEIGRRPGMDLSVEFDNRVDVVLCVPAGQRLGHSTEGEGPLRVDDGTRGPERGVGRGEPPTDRLIALGRLLVRAFRHIKRVGHGLDERITANIFGVQHGTCSLRHS